MTTTIRINPPGDESIGSRQYQRSCIFALEPSVTRLIELATEAGWDEQQVVYALICIAAPHINDRTLLGTELNYQ